MSLIPEEVGDKQSKCKCSGAQIEATTRDINHAVGSQRKVSISNEQHVKNVTIWRRIQ